MYARSVKFLLALGWIFSSSCASTPNRDFSIGYFNQRNVEAAKEANERGLSLIADNKIDQAEHAFREASQHNIQCAAAHNNLGLVLFQKNRFYEAATELRMASQLEPSAIEPLKNLALLYDRIGWTKQAQAQRDLVLEKESCEKIDR